MRITKLGLRMALACLAAGAMWVGGANLASAAAAPRASAFTPAVQSPAGGRGGNIPRQPQGPFSPSIRRPPFQGNPQHSGNGFPGGNPSSGGYVPTSPYDYYVDPGDYWVSSYMLSGYSSGPVFYGYPGITVMMSGYSRHPVFSWSGSGSAMMSGYSRYPTYFGFPGGSAMVSGYGF
jgi:hypothetical protein